MKAVLERALLIASSEVILSSLYAIVLQPSRTIKKGPY